MTVEYGFYNSLNGDRKYDTEDISKMFDGVFHDGVFATFKDGLVVVENAGMKVDVSTGKAWFDHTWTRVDAPETLTLSDADIASDRIDVIVLETDSSESVRANSIKVLEGTPATTPTAPSLTNGTYVNQYPLAEVYVTANVSSVTQADITNKIGTTDCPLASALLDTIDVDALIQQWDAAYNVWITDSQQSVDDWFTDINNWKTTEQSDFESWRTTQQNDFDTWFQAIKDDLSDSVVTTLYSLIYEATSYLQLGSDYTVSGDTISVSTTNDQTQKIFLEIEDVVEGFPIKISRNGASPKPLVSVLGNDIERMDTTYRFFEIYEDVSNFVMVHKANQNFTEPLPINSIVAFSGTSIPVGWAICDGTNGTPNLIDKFIKGGSVSGNTTNPHNHVSIDSGGSHTHGIGYSGSHVHASDPSAYGINVQTNSDEFTAWGGSHTHPGGGSGEHTHSEVSETYGDLKHYKLFFIIKRINI